MEPEAARTFYGVDMHGRSQRTTGSGYSIKSVSRPLFLALCLCGVCLSADIVKRPGEAKYDVVFATADVRIGGDGLNFTPEILMEKWGECWFKLTATDNVSLQKESVVGNKVSIRLGNNTHRYYVTGDGKLEYEIIFANKPPSNKVVLNCQWSEGLKFCKQLPLEDEWARQPMDMTLPEYLDMHNRPDNVINSYAVYYEKKGNQYKTGKFCHIYRPFIIGADPKADPNAVWGDLDFDEVARTLTIIIPQDFLDKAVYPVIVDPLLGYDTLGGSSVGSLGFTIGEADTTDGTGGTVIKAFINVRTVDGADPGVKVGIYDCAQGDGDPQGEAVLFTSAQFDVIIQPDDNEQAVAGPVLAATTKYFVCYTPENGSTDIAYDTLTGEDTWSINHGNYGTAFQVEAGAWTGPTDRSYSVWFEYEPAGNIGALMQAVRESKTGGKQGKSGGKQ